MSNDQVVCSRVMADKDCQGPMMLDGIPVIYPRYTHIGALHRHLLQQEAYQSVVVLLLHRRSTPLGQVEHVDERCRQCHWKEPGNWLNCGEQQGVEGKDGPVSGKPPQGRKESRRSLIESSEVGYNIAASAEGGRRSGSGGRVHDETFLLLWTSSLGESHRLVIDDRR